MGYRFHGLGLCAAIVVGAFVPQAQAVAITHANGVGSLPPSPAVKIACGWDYPCPPDPTYGRQTRTWPRRQPQDQVYIQNNYGPVTIHVDGGEKLAQPAVPRPCCQQQYFGGWPAPCGPVPCGEGERRAGDWPPLCGLRPCVDDKPKEDCGVRCWWKRIRSGYCGHGCWAYREQARIEAEEKEERKFEKKAEREEEKEERREAWDYPREAWRPYYEPPPPYERPWDREASPRYESPKIDERTPIERYDGPKYP